MGIQTYRDLEVWQKSMDAVVEIYRLTRCFPAEEQFGLTGQIRRAAVSIAANIAEGHGRLHRGEFLRQLSFARGSLTEVETHLQIAVRLDYLKREQAREVWPLLQELGRLLNGLIRSLGSNQHSSNGNNRISENEEPYEVDYTDPRSPSPDPWA